MTCPPGSSQLHYLMVSVEGKSGLIALTLSDIYEKDNELKSYICYQLFILLEVLKIRKHQSENISLEIKLGGSIECC